jgi:hypothetical protein
MRRLYGSRADSTPEFAEIIAGTDKQHWMTEASDNGNESEADVNLAAATGVRFLNDLNHGVTHWVYFIGFHESPDVTNDQDNATKFMGYDFIAGTSGSGIGHDRLHHTGECRFDRLTPNRVLGVW